MSGDMAERLDDTRSRAYRDRLRRLEGARWKRWLDVQAPYRWNLRRLRLGRTLEVGCGIGRNLLHLGEGAVGVDHSPHAVETARARGCTAFVPEELRASPYADALFDALLFAHVLEHTDAAGAETLVRGYLGYLRRGGRVVWITPQEAGQRSDPTHVELFDWEKLEALARRLGLERERAYSFPFPRFAGRFFVHNEFVFVARRP
jgi:SAM-dependent methyltransferase